VSAKRKAVRRLVVPVVLVISTAALAVSATTATTGCGDDAPTPRTDAGTPDTPII
jgi:hypothetical protein